MFRPIINIIPPLGARFLRTRFWEFSLSSVSYSGRSSFAPDFAASSQHSFFRFFVIQAFPGFSRQPGPLGENPLLSRYFL